MSSSKEIIKTVEDLGREKGISREILADALHEAIVAATVKRIGKYLEPEVTVDLDKGLINILDIPKKYVSLSKEKAHTTAKYIQLYQYHRKQKKIPCEF